MAGRTRHASTDGCRGSRSLGRIALAATIGWGTLALAPAAGAQTLNFRQYTAAEGLPQAPVMGMFLPFHRLHGRTEYEGTGIGLTICQKIVQRHHGTIRAESVPGRGSRFVVALPTQERIGERHAA